MGASVLGDRLGYSSNEYFLSGTAEAYERDGAGDLKVVDAADYHTRILVYRPVDAARFNGTVIVEWLNVSGGLDAAPDWTSAHTVLMRKNFAWVGVSAQAVGVIGGGSLVGLDFSLKNVNPTRYGALEHPGDSFSYDMFSQVAEMIRNPVGARPLGDLKVRRLVAAGDSQSAFFLVTYVNAIHPLARLFDGFLIHSRAAGGAPLSQAPQPAVAVPNVARIRSDAGVPVLTFETETDLSQLDFFAARQPDGEHFRLWEVAGTAHADTYQLVVGPTDRGRAAADTTHLPPTRTVAALITCDLPINAGPQHYVLNAAFAQLDRWVRSGIPAARAPRLVVMDGSPPIIVRDASGNALGGIRSPQVDAPVATLSGDGQTGSQLCRLFGTTTPFEPSALSALYPTHASYVGAVQAAKAAAVQAGFLLPLDAKAISAAAAASAVPNAP